MIKYIPILPMGIIEYCLNVDDVASIDHSKEYVAILKSDLDRLNETEKWRQLQAQLLSVQESALFPQALSALTSEP